MLTAPAPGCCCAVLWSTVMLTSYRCGSSQAGALENGTGDAREELASPLLASRNEQGIKRKGIIYSPRKSWWAGMTFVVLSIVIFAITIVTAFVK